MPILGTAKRHFDEDIQRAEKLISHAETLPDDILKDDILRSGWMMAVGACDAFFSDAYADLIARTLRAKEKDPQTEIPDRLNNLKVPVLAVIRGADTGGWRWRMAARELIEDENVLSLEKIKKLFNHFFRDNSKIINVATVEKWILHPKSKSRMFGITPTRYRALNSSQKGHAKKPALDKFQSVFEEIFQRRHDCIHNCDRPKSALQGITPTSSKKCIENVVFLVSRSEEAIVAEFPEYLGVLGFSGAVRNQVCG